MTNGAQPGFVAQIRSFPSSFWVANTMEIFERMAWYGFFALSSLYITGATETGGLGFTSETRGAIQAIIPFLLYLMPVVTGALADRYGFKRMFIISYVCMAVFYYLLGQFKDLPTFMVAFFFVAVAAAIFKPVVVGTVARVTNESNSRMGFGVFYMMVNVGGFLGPIVAGLVRAVSWEWVFIASAGWAAINLVICIIFYREPERPADWKPRKLAQVGETIYEVLGNLRFFITVFVAIILLMVAQFEPYGFGIWPHAVIAIVVWIALNLIYDRMLPAGSGTDKQRRTFAQRMHCSDWRFALYLLILSGFWTSFNQIFLTMPEYIRDFSETKPLVNAGRAIGGEALAEKLAAIEQRELYTEVDTVIRQARGVNLLVEPEGGADEPGTATEADRMAKYRTYPGVTGEVIAQLEALAGEINAPGTPEPLQPVDLLQSARTILQYKVRVAPVEWAQTLAKIPAEYTPPSQEARDTAFAHLNKAIAARGRTSFTAEDKEPVIGTIATMLQESGPTPSKETLETTAAAISTDTTKVDVDELATAVRVLAYRDAIWPVANQARQFNPEFIVNLNALGIVCFQVLVSFLIARFHQFTGMIIGMVVAAVGIGMSAFAGDNGFFGAGGLGLIVCAGILTFSFGEMMASPTSQEYVGRIAPPDRVALYMGYYFVAVALGNLFGGILSGQLYGKLARDMQRPDLMWLAFGAIMLLTALIFLVYNKMALPKKTENTQ